MNYTNENYKLYIVTEGHVVAYRSRDGFYGRAAGGWLKLHSWLKGRWTQDGRVGRGPLGISLTYSSQAKTPMLIFLSGIYAGYVILWHKINLLLMIAIILFILAKHCQK